MICPECGKELKDSGLRLSEEEYNTSLFLAYREDSTKQTVNILKDLLKDPEVDAEKLLNNLLNLEAGTSLMKEKFFRKISEKYGIPRESLYLEGDIIYIHA